MQGACFVHPIIHPNLAQHIWSSKLLIYVQVTKIHQNVETAKVDMLFFPLAWLTTIL